MKRSNLRIAGIFTVIAVLSLVVVINVFVVTIGGVHMRSGTNILASKEGSQERQETLPARRGYIRDRNGSIIAQDQDTYTIKAVLSKDRTGAYAYVDNKEFTAAALAPILGMSEEEIMNYLNLQDQGVYETLLGEKGKGLTIEQKEAIEAIEYTPDPNKKYPGLPGIEFDKTTTRFYSPGKFASNLLGFANYDEEQQRIVGQIGIEAFQDAVLKGSDGLVTYQKDALGYKLPGTEKTEKAAVNGNDVYLTLDKDVQSALEVALQSTMEANGAERAWGVIMEVETGKILAWAGYPTFDLNKRNSESYVDLPSMYVFEPGSVMKPFAYAAAMDAGVYKGDDTVFTGRFCIAYDENGGLYRTSGPCEENGNINDAERAGWGTISFDDGLIRSSNTCIATLLTDYLSTDVFWDYLDKFGFFKQTGIEGLSQSEEFGIKNDKTPLDRVAAGFGQGSAVTTLQLMQAYTAIFNDGIMVRPYYIDKIVNPNTNEIIESGKTQYVYTDEQGQPVPVLKKETTEKILKLMEQIVEDPEKGTAHKYKIDGVSMVAKTGTGEIAKDGSYGDTVYTSSIMAASPADDPKIMMYYAFESSNYLYYSADYFKNAFMTALDAASINNAQPLKAVAYDNSYGSTYQEYTMPTLVNHTLQYANWKLDEMDVDRIIIGDGNQVVSQYPKMGTTIGTKQHAFVKTDGINYTMPDMTGWAYKDVQIFKELSGMSIEMTGQGVVVWQNLDAGTSIFADTEIKVTLD